MMGPGMFDGVIRGLLITFSFFLLLAFGAGFAFNSCVSRFGHPTVSWSK